MKKKSFLAVALAAVMFASCSNEEVAVIDTNVGDASLVVTLPGAVTADTRAVEDPIVAGTIVPNYTNAIVYLKDEGGNAVGYKLTEEELTAKKKVINKITKPYEVLVVVNSGTIALPEGDIMSAALTTKLNSLAIADQNTGGAQDVTLMGSTKEISSAGDKKLAATVPLKSLVSRFEIGTVIAGEGLENITLKAVYINYFYNTYERIAGSAQTFTQDSWKDPYTPAWATDSGSTEVTAAESKCYAYQVFAGDMVPHIIFKVSGEVSNGYKLSTGETGAFENMYVTIKSFTPALTAIEANKIYKVGLGAGAGTGGIEIPVDKITPKPELNEFDLTVNVTVASWTEENLTPNI